MKEKGGENIFHIKNNINTLEQIAVQQGTAQAGIDYNATSIPASVTWVYGDANNKNILVQLLNPDRLINPSRSFSLVFTSTSATLLNGAPGNVVSQLVSSITINDDDLGTFVLFT